MTAADDRALVDGPMRPRPAELAGVTALLVRAQSGQSRAVLDELAVLDEEAREQHALERAQWLRFVRFVAFEQIHARQAADEVAGEMIRLAEPYDDLTWEAFGHTLRGMTLAHQSQFEPAYDELARAMVLLGELGATGAASYALGHAINSAALTLTSLDLYELAQDALERMQGVATVLCDHMLLTLNAFNSGWLHLTWAFDLDLIGRHDDAKTHYRRTIEAFGSAPRGLDEVEDSAWPSEVTVQSSAAHAMLGQGVSLEADLRKNLETVEPTQRHETTLIGHLALARAYANDGDLDRALQEAEVACALGDTQPRLHVHAARAYGEYATLLREKSGTSPATEAYARLAARLMRDRWEERRARVVTFEQRLEHERVRDELRRRAAAYLSDTLTGLGNRRLIEIRLPEQLVESAAAGRPMSVAFVDIDDFKSVNDEISHLAGDDMLRELAQEMRAVMAADDVVARFGGEEFVIVLPGRDSSAAYAQMEALRARVERRVWRALPPGRGITVTVGVAQAWERATRTQMLAAADEALLSAKRAGKNRVEVRANPLAARPVTSPAPAPET